MRFQPNLPGGPVLSWLATAFLIGILPGLAEAQARPNPNSLPAAETNREMRDREANITLMERGKDEAKNREAAQKQMNEDFQRIQTEDADMITAFTSANPPDYQKILDDAADIRTRATRLKNLLVLPPSGKEDKRKKERDADLDLQASMPLLSGTIKSFVSNPIFQQQAGQPVDYRNVVKARHDLDEIIELSSKVRAAAEKMSKAAGGQK